MHVTSSYLPYKDTGYFSPLVTDYLAGDEKLRCYYQDNADEAGLKAAIDSRSQFPVDRQLLADTLEQQYQSLNKSEATIKNLQLLREENTFTICTAHQPNLLTGYLYFVYKIIHAIKLAEDLNGKNPDKNFVPVYYMGSEDADLDELGTFRFNGKKFIWDGDGQKGAVGRMNTKTLKPLLNDVFKLVGPPGNNAEALKEMLTEAYLKHKNISDATQYLVNELFGKYGLIVLNPDVPAFKRAFIPVMKEDLVAHTPHQIVTEQIAKLEEHYKSQAHPREINLFYLDDQIRERIEQHGDRYKVVNTELEWSHDELLALLETNPEKFSPNVILRGLFQETILPNIAFIGGGAEVAYWLQLKSLFDNYKVFYPAILLRQSVLWIPETMATLRQTLNLTTADIFLKQEDIFKQYINANAQSSLHTDAEDGEIEKIFASLEQKVLTVDKTLKEAVGASLTKMRKQFKVLEQKMYRAEKRKETVHLERISKLKVSVFPNNSLQERFDNFMPWFLQFGFEYFDLLKDNMEPLKNEFLIIEETASA